MSKIIEFGKESYFKNTLILHKKATKPWIIFRFLKDELPSRKELFNIIGNSCRNESFSYYVEVMDDKNAKPKQFLIGTWVRHFVK